MSSSLKKLYNLTLSIEKRLQANTLSEEDRNLFCKELESCGLDQLARLSRRVKVGMSLEQFMCFIVPVEREFDNKVTDVEILIETEDSQKTNKKNDLIIVLDNIRSPFNMGAVVRTCDALGVFELIVTGYTPDFTDERVQKISMGAWKNVTLTKLRDLTQVRAYLRDKKYKMICVETVTKAESIHEAELETKTALVFGNERFGISKKYLFEADGVVKLPTFGIKNSLNINAALTACGYEWVRQNGQS